jgi:hypothetical protein
MPTGIVIASRACGEAIQGRKHRAEALDCFVAALLAMTTLQNRKDL